MRQIILNSHAVILKEKAEYFVTEAKYYGVKVNGGCGFRCEELVIYEFVVTLKLMGKCAPAARGLMYNTNHHKNVSKRKNNGLQEIKIYHSSHATLACPKSRETSTHKDTNIHSI